MTKKKEFNYYESELNRIQVDKTYSPQVQVFDGCGEKTKTLSINLESIPELRKFLDRVETELKNSEGK